MMMNLLLLAILTISGVHSMKNGRHVNASEYPYVVAIQYYMAPWCSGTIIDQHHILTTGHTVKGCPSSSLLVVTSKAVVNSPWLESFSVSDVVLHPGYKQIFLPLNQNDPYWENDIALLRLTEPLVWGPMIAPVSLSTTDAISHRCFECAMISWNYSEEHTSNGLVLMWEAVHIVDNSLCHQWGISVSPDQHCFSDLFDTAFISFEDIGSPIICGNSMIGFIAKPGQNGVTSSPATFLSTFSYSGFFTDVIDGFELEVRTGEFPYTVSIWRNNRHFVCSGIIINAKQIMTAEECIQAHRGIYRPEILKIAVGVTDVWYVNRDIKYLAVKTIEFHPEYQGTMKHDFVLLTMSEPFLWSPTVQSLRLADAENFSTQQFCQVVFWKRGDGEARKEARKLVKLHVVLVSLATPDLELEPYQFAARNPTSTNPNMYPTELGSPIVCRGHPLGFLIKAHISGEEWLPYMIFHRIHPYVERGFLTLD